MSSDEPDESVGIGDQAVVRKIPASDGGEQEDVSTGPSPSRRAWVTLAGLLVLAMLGVYQVVEIVAAVV